MSDAITFTLDGREVEARPGETIWQVAERHGIAIPHLCWLPEPGYRADGNCRACMVEVEGERVLVASCIRKPNPGMKVTSASERARTAQRMVMELLLADQPPREAARHPESKLWHWADRMGMRDSHFPAREHPAPDLSHPATADASTAAWARLTRSSPTNSGSAAPACLSATTKSSGGLY